MPPFGIARAALDAGLVVDVPGDPRQAGDLLHRLREARADRATGPSSPNAGMRTSTARGLARVDDVPAEAELARAPAA